MTYTIVTEPVTQEHIGRNVLVRIPLYDNKLVFGVLINVFYEKTGPLYKVKTESGTIHFFKSAILIVEGVASARGEVMFYRKKPIVIEAIQFVGKNYIYCLDFMGVTGERRTKIIQSFDKGTEDFEGALYIHTLEGTMKCDINDYIIKGVKGEFYPCKPDIFEETYEVI